MNSDYFTNPQKAPLLIVPRISDVAISGSDYKKILLNGSHVQANETIQELSDSRSQFTSSSKTSSSCTSQPVIRAKTKTSYEPIKNGNQINIRRATQKVQLLNSFSLNIRQKPFKQLGRPQSKENVEEYRGRTQSVEKQCPTPIKLNYRISKTSPEVAVALKKMPLSFFEKNKILNKKLLSKWMSDQSAQLTIQSFYEVLKQLMKESPHKAMSIILKMVQFKQYLKIIFQGDKKSFTFPDLDYETICSKIFSLNLYENFLQNKFTAQQISQYRKLQKSMKQSTKKEINDNNPYKLQINIPSCHEFIREILLIDIETLSQMIRKYMSQKQTDGICILGRNLIYLRKEVESIQISSVERLQERKTFNFNQYNQLKAIQLNDGGYQGLNSESVLDIIEKIENNYGNLHLVSSTSRQVYKTIQNVLLDINQDRL